MPLVAAKCTSCGATLSVDSTKDAAICKYCGTPFIIEKAINHYHTTQNISGSVVNVYGGNITDFVIRAGTLVNYQGSETEIEIPDTVKIIGKEAFCGCQGLTQVVIPKSVVKIEEKAFHGSGIQEIIVPESVKTIGAGAFSYCRNLKKARLPHTLDYILPDCLADDMFRGCTELVDFDIPKGIKYIGCSAFADCIQLDIKIPSTVKAFGKRAFAGCKKLKTIVIPMEMTNIGDETFSRCSNLSSVHIPQGLKTIGHYAFNDCSNLIDVVIPNSVISIGQFAFKNCTRLESLNIPDSVSDISSSTFEGCDNLTIYASSRWKRAHKYAIQSLKKPKKWSNFLL